MINQDYKVVYSPPIIITWDKTPMNVQFSPAFTYAIGLPPEKLIDTDSGCNVLIRPELRFKDNQDKIIGSIIAEYTVQVFFLNKQLPKKEVILPIVKYVHGLFGTEFQNRNKTLLIDLVPSYPDQLILDAIVLAMKQSDWQ